MVLLTRTPKSFAAARQKRLKISGNSLQYDNLDVFISEQELMRRLARELILPVFELDVSDNNIPHAVDCIADWLESTGGLYMAD